MKSNSIFGFILILFLCMFGTFGISLSEGTQKDKELFTDIIKGTQFDKGRDPTVVRTRLVNINFNLLSKDKRRPTSKSDMSRVLLLNLFDDTVFTAIIDRGESITPEFYSWVGHLKGIKQSKVILVVGDGLMHGSITLPNAFYQIRYIDNGIHYICEIDQSSFPSEADPIPIDTSDKKFAPDVIVEDDGSIMTSKFFPEPPLRKCFLMSF